MITDHLSNLLFQKVSSSFYVDITSSGSCLTSGQEVAGPNPAISAWRWVCRFPSPHPGVGVPTSRCQRWHLCLFSLSVSCGPQTAARMYAPQGVEHILRMTGVIMWSTLSSLKLGYCAIYITS
jgi:hypothetical protein